MIIKSYPENINKATLYAMTSGKQSEKMSDYAGEELDLKAYVLYDATDAETGENKRVLSVLLSDNRIVSTISKSFLEEFTKIAEIWGCENLPPLQVYQMTSKKGRSYITCGIKIQAV